MDYSASYKIILLGEEGVGKTSLFNRIKTGKFYDGHWQSTTGGSDCYQYPTTVDNDRVMVRICMCQLTNYCVVTIYIIVCLCIYPIQWYIASYYATLCFSSSNYIHKIIPIELAFP